LRERAGEASDLGERSIEERLTKVDVAEQSFERILTRLKRRVAV
jgi:hypothetical protein